MTQELNNNTSMDCHNGFMWQGMIFFLEVQKIKQLMHITGCEIHTIQKTMTAVSLGVLC